MSDDRAVAVVRSSTAYRLADGLLRGVEAAWRGSIARAMVAHTPAEGVRFWSIAALTASITALAMMPLAADPRPLAWLVPSTAGLVSLLILVRSSR